MKKYCNDLYDAFLNELLDVLREKNINNKQFITKKCIELVKEFYEHGITVEVNIVALLDNKAIALYWNKDDRDLQIIIGADEVIQYYMSDDNDSFKDEDIYSEEGYLNNADIPRIARWFTHGEPIEENYQAIKQIRKRDGRKNHD